ncbi:hypothetical protein [Pseudomonas sp. H9]|uniref:hypothetical protein n=1 Tax=Pseudomonas sp. H9 TaxID=483968 RepID=UPI0027400A0C|nr:hypothetical protein [Pseudomonas sp. H9]
MSVHLRWERACPAIVVYQTHRIAGQARSHRLDQPRHLGMEAVALDSGGSLHYFIDYMRDKAKTRGWFLTILWEGFVGIIIFNAPLAVYLQRKKLYPPPDLTYPAIIEWSKPLPPEQWAKRSPELEIAIAEREAELAAQTAQEQA